MVGFNRLVLFALVTLFTADLLAAPSVGNRVPDFTLPEASGASSYDLKKAIAKNKFTVILFIATRCPYSNAYNDRMAKLPARFAGKGVEFVGINSNKTEPNAEIVKHARKNGFAFPVLKDEANRVADQYDAKKTPEVFVIDSQGILRYHGRIDENYEDASAVKSPDLDNALNALLANKTVSAPTTKAFGCSIKRI
ncbi:MAG: redoxin domain-containing protein [Spirochaetia bacterium]|nr:redoxin domain-containing protein [Spirochaetia bacterium]